MLTETNKLFVHASLSRTVTAPAAVRPTNGGRPSRSRREPGSWGAFVYLVPALVVFVAFFFFPLGRSIYLSFQRSDLFGRPRGFVGVEHYTDLFTDPGFGKTLLVTLGFTLLTVIVKRVSGKSLRDLMRWANMQPLPGGGGSSGGASPRANAPTMSSASAGLDR